jgi:AcrR family transcriptional regulator
VIPGSSEAAGGAGKPGVRLGLAPPAPFSPRPAPADLAEVAPADEPCSDGRLARGQRTRRKVAAALVELLHAGDPDPTARAVAERAGVSLRLVFHHFADIDDLYHLVASQQVRQLRSGLPPRSPRLNLDRRIERVVGHRAALYEEISPVRRALVRRVAASPGISDTLAAADGLLRQNLEAAFGPELETLPPAARTVCLHAIDTATSWEAWERLRTTSGLGVRSAKRVMTRMVAAVAPGA